MPEEKEIEVGEEYKNLKPEKENNHKNLNKLKGKYLIKIWHLNKSLGLSESVVSIQMNICPVIKKNLGW